MPQRLDRSTIEGWLFKCNPNVWDIESALGDGRPIASWRVQPSYRLKLIEAGDPAMIWVTGSERSRGPTPGVWAIGHTTGTFIDDYGDQYWLDTDQACELELFAELVTQPIDVLPRTGIRANPETAGLEVLRQPQMSNPSYVSPKEYKAIEQMAGGWPTYPHEANG